MKLYDTQIRWLVAAFAATALALMMAGPVAAREYVEVGGSSASSTDFNPSSPLRLANVLEQRAAYIPGVTDMGAGVSQGARELFIPGVTDVPSSAVSQVPTASVVAADDDGIAWQTVLVGTGAALTAALLMALAFAQTRRRSVAF